jgi:hypothetical protein
VSSREQARDPEVERREDPERKRSRSSPPVDKEAIKKPRISSD